MMRNLQSTSTVFRLTFICLIAAALLSCSENEPSTITVKGNLKNLPAGSVVLVALRSNKWKTIDSISTKDGLFEFNLSAAEFPDPILVELNHYDNDRIKRPIVFKTGVKGKAGYGGIEATSEFYLEDGVEISGPVEIEDTGWYKRIYTNKPNLMGRQSRVMYEDTASFGISANLGKLAGLIKQHPYSFYYLETIRRRGTRLSDAQFTTLFNEFNQDVRESETGREMKDYFETRSTHKLTPATLLPDQNGNLQPVLGPKAELNMVVLCGQCELEIPELKKIHQQFAGNEAFKMVSISMDEEKAAVNDTMEQEIIPWQQLRITAEANRFAYQLFGYKSVIPLILFVDKKGKILDKHLGYSEKSIKEFTDFISKKISTTTR